MQEDERIHSESVTGPEPLPAQPDTGVKVYDRPAGLRALPAWLFVLLALLIVASLWLLFTYVV